MGLILGVILVLFIKKGGEKKKVKAPKQTLPFRPDCFVNNIAITKNLANPHDRKI